jgi:very-short-patch-repair endonuclease
VGFYRAEARLAIEIDGDTHAASNQAAYDSSRTACLEERGYKVIRSQARQIEGNLKDVLKAIRAACEARTGGISPEAR